MGFYASLVNINAYHQPGVEGGKKAAGAIISLQLKIVELLNQKQTALTVAQIGAAIGSRELETIFKICEHLSANAAHKVQKTAGTTPFDATYQIQSCSVEPTARATISDVHQIHDLHDVHHTP